MPSFIWSTSELIAQLHLISLSALTGTQEKESHQKKGRNKEEAQHQEDGHQEGLQEEDNQEIGVKTSNLGVMLLAHAVSTSEREEGFLPLSLLWLY